MTPWKFLGVTVVCVAIYLVEGQELAESTDDGTDVSINDQPIMGGYDPSVKSTKGGRKRVFVGGCTSQPEPPLNGRLRCSMDSGCIATCDYNYKFPNGVTQLAITCYDRRWNIFGTEWNSVPHCEPICMPECQNNGVCVAPHQCDCPEQFTGPQCQFENKPCLNFPPPVLNSYKRCNTKSCTISCMKDFTFPDGTAVTNLLCKNGNWEPTRHDWVSVPDCEPVCNPPCQNGGNCLPSNMCQCPQAFRGPQCQYSADACNAERIGFNGGFYCTSIGDSYHCTLNCPAGVEFEFAPAISYTCTYDKGVFEPQPIPQCKFSENMNVISLGTTYNSYVKETNHSWSFQDIYGSNSKQNPNIKNTYDVVGLFNNHEDNLTTNTVLFDNLVDNTLVIAQEQPKPKTCFTWGGIHYKTFDDTVFSFDSDCSHILVQESQDGLFTIIVENSRGCRTNENCHRIVKLFLQGKEFVLSRDEDGVPRFRTPRKFLPIPAQLPGLRVEMSAHFTVVTLDSLGVQLKWDGGLLLQVEALENMWNKTVGLCGRMNGEKRDDMVGKSGDPARSVAAFASSWRTESIGESCDEYPQTKHSCVSKPMLTKEAVEFCTDLLTDSRFHACSSTINLSELETACLWDYCACNHEDRRKCACDTMNVYIRQCAHKKIVPLSGWRTNETCPMQCDNGRVYMPCGPKTQESCWTGIERKSEDSNCEEGCFCPEGTLAHEGRCIYPEECPCRLRGKLFQPGVSVPKDCNTCTCSAGKWICTQTRCSARCSVVGDPHYTTFDGKHYDFMGKCKYYLMKGDDYSVEGENVPCSGAISENLGILPTDAPSCTKTVTINFRDVSVKLKQNRQILINGDDVSVLPTIFSGIRIRIVSSIFVVVHVPNGLEIWWDGISRVYVNAPPEFYEKTRGLCGTFSASQKDDFLTPDGDVEQGAISFANKWKTDDYCTDVPDREMKHPCHLNPQKRGAAEQYCSHLYSSVFSDCHWHVDPETFHKDCLFDMCACEVDVESCLCPTLAAYAKDCAAVGVKLSWRHQISECKVHCPRDQVYQICGNSCTRSCADISMYQDCKQECVEGCNCPEGQTLDSNGECIPIGQCPCTYSGMEFKSGHREVRPGNKALELCTCAGGLWNCQPATPEDIKEYPAASDLQTTCVASKNLKLSDCVPPEPRTCRNMHKPEDQTPSLCKSGCVCMSGFVLDAPNGTCIQKDSCPCHHGGQSYKDGSVIQNDCNTCECQNGKWKCTDRTCAGVCSAWGDSHYKTFDGRIYDFQGVCDYVLVKSSLSREECFDVSIQNVPCGTTGVSCSKSVTLTVGSGDNQEKIVLTRGKDLPNDKFKRIAMRNAGLFVFVDVPDLGLTLQWDKGTRVYVRLDPKWKTRTRGLCGDYNDDNKDDFKTPSGGISEVSPNLFGDSWKKDDYCPEPKDVKDPCEQHPERKLFAVQKCGILKSPIFHPCHSEVDVEPYLHNCVFDTCGCDSGGDCECLCTALAAYAHECSARGVPIKWRSQDLCPMQCDEKCSTYSSCVPTCPRETCDNLMILKDKSHLCSQDTCVEGCSFKSCPENQVYLNESYSECVPRNSCKPFCIEVDGISFYEGDTVSSDGCETCFCSRGKVLCKGEPCTTFKPVTVPLEEPHRCVDGWTAWLNKDPAVKGKKYTDVEPIPTLMDLANIEGSAVCEPEQMVDIKCRSVKRQLTPKETGLDVDCSLERGLICKSQPGSPCVDFEISVLCQCSKPTTEVAVPTVMEKEECEVNEYKPHPTDCHLFYHCGPGQNGNELVEKTCGPDMLYNLVTQNCDWPETVLAQRPECSQKTTTPKDDWTVDKKTKQKTTLSTTLEKKIITTKACKEGETWSNCAVRCSKACQYYQSILLQEGFCNDNTDCISGCVPLGRETCAPTKFWRDSSTCVDITDCSCKSHDGSPVIPGAVMMETECEICQCINNYYTCDNSSCSVATKETSTPEQPVEETTVSTGKPTQLTTQKHIEEHTIVVPSTVSPPADCVSGNFVPLLKQMKDQVSFDASGTRGPLFWPENSILGVEVPQGSSGYWEPEFVDVDQWIDVKFKEPEPIYGIVVQGSMEEEKFVTSYKVLFSEDGHTFSYVLDDQKSPRIFRGPVDGVKAVEQIFYQPIEAKIVRINPQTWHDGVAMRVELLGCQEVQTTPSVIFELTTPVMFEKIVVPVCKDPMGLDDGLMLADQVTASSTSTDLLPSLTLTSPTTWHPKIDNPHQFVEFDFLEPRNLTGIITKGGEDTWTTLYKVFYSNDHRHWNPVTEENGQDREFLGNFDSETPTTNYFERPIHARYLKVQPVKWHGHIGLRVEVLGCFLPYVRTTTVVSTTTTTERVETTVRTTEAPEKECKVCDGISVENQVPCRCEEPFWWNGDSCVPKQHCPCVIGHINYNVGSMFETEDCQQCICTLNGIPACQPKKCEACEDPQSRPVVTELCNCVCKPCPAETRLCPTSNVCINETLWCNGVQDCPDDEKDCPVFASPSTPPHLEVTETTTMLSTMKPIVCHDPVCPPGYRTILKSSAKSRYTSDRHKDATSKRFSKTKGHRRTGHYRSMIGDMEDTMGSTECPQFTCIPVKPPPTLDSTKKPSTCPEAQCPPDYTVVYEKMSMHKLQKCPKYSCKPPPPQEVVCNVTGRTFNTFDKLEYKYDICNHILARDMFSNKWYITLEKQCVQNGICTRVLVVTVEDDVVVLYPDQHVDINQYTFTPKQIARLGDKLTSFKLSNIGDVTYLLSNHYGFWVIWDSNSNVKIGVSTKLAGRVDGLCGYFDGNTMNDRQLPDGSQARSTVDFGNSWAMEGVPECDPQVCPYDVQAEAWKMCNTIKDRSLIQCSGVVDLEKFISRCVESSCTCLRSNHTYDDCRCRSLTNFVTECQAGDFDIDLSTWRSIHDCPVACAPPFVHKDCFRNKCEPSCENLQQVEPCPVMQGVCFSGCFCPEGTVRDGDNCVPPMQCKDCTCEWLGNSKFISFDRKNIKFDGNCTYVLSRDVVENSKEPREHAYQVLVSNTVCDTGTCTEAITVLYKDHVVQVKQSAPLQEFETIVDGVEVKELPYNSTWLVLEETTSRNLKLLIPNIQLEITAFKSNFAFTLTLPSHVFGGSMEGLCGNCNDDSEDDLKKLDGEIADNADDFGSSWQVKESPQDTNLNLDACTTNLQNKCILPPAEQDPCRRLLNSLEFGQCHNLVDPMPYLIACQDTVCTGGDYCDTFEAYSRKCQEIGVCSIWRSSEVCPYVCPPHLEYRPCSSGCKETCDSLMKPDTKCQQNLVEGCFCPHGQVLHNDTCIPKQQCLVCDNEGHVEGDTWSPDVCTKCTCDQKVVSCQKTECPAVDTICEENMTPSIVNGTENDCCAKYICVPKWSTTVAPFCVEDVQKPECGFGQVMKITTDSDGCKKFICECLPTDECPTINEVSLEVEEMEPGFVRAMNTSGCCPRPVHICDPGHCPPAPPCPPYHERISSVKPDSCCPDYNCLPPKDLCLYNPTTPITTNVVNEEQTLVKKIDEEWTDGKCTTCKCEASEEGAKSKCFTTECLSVEKHPDISDFVLEEVIFEDKCCPTYERSACKDKDQVYEVGQTWQTNPEDSCVTMECVKDSKGVQKQTKVQECNTVCDVGYEYQPSEDKRVSCCGRCVPTACVIGEETRNIEEEWFSADHCTKFSCNSNNGSVFVQSVTEKCPQVDPMETMEYAIEEKFSEGVCCPQIVRTACVHNGSVYKPGEKWKSTEDKCVTGVCVLDSNISKRTEVEVCKKDCLPGWIYVEPKDNECCGTCNQIPRQVNCSKDCLPGWSYEEPKDNECCGRCKQNYCSAGDMLYEPGSSWSSEDNCTTYTCTQQNDQLSISSTSTICPDLTNCPADSIYSTGCCKQCNLTLAQKVETCAADVLDPRNTVGMFTLHHRVHGVCTNLEEVEGITECRGRCESTSYFDTESWSQVVDCQCCQPREHVGRIVQLTCQNNKKLKKQVAVPVSCSCEACGPGQSAKGRKGRVKG